MPRYAHMAGGLLNGMGFLRKEGKSALGAALLRSEGMGSRAYMAMGRGGREYGPAATYMRGRKRAMIGGGVVGGAALMNRGRGMGHSSGATGQMQSQDPYQY